MGSRIKWDNDTPVFYQCSGKEEDISLDEAFRSLLHEKDSSYSILRAAEYEKEKYNSDFLKLPIGLSLEAQAFGAKVVMDQKGLRLQEYPYKSAQDFIDHHKSLYCPSLTEQIIGCITMSKEQPVILKLTGAFSLLASLVEPMKLYREMKNDSESLHDALKILNQWLIDYATEALKGGARVISFADTIALCELIGKDRYIEFAGNYQRDLFIELIPWLDNAVIHICGKNSVDLLRCDFMKSERLSCKEQTYGKELLARTKEPDFHFCGLGCMSEEGENSQWIWKLKLY